MRDTVVGQGYVPITLFRLWHRNVIYNLSSPFADKMPEEGRALREKEVESCMSRGSHKSISAYFNVSLGFR